MPNYAEYRVAKAIENSDMIRAVRAAYPKYSKMQQSLINNPEKNAVCLLPEAEQLLVKAFGPGPGLSISRPDPPKKNHDNKTKPKRLCLRVSEQMFDGVQACMEKMCFATMQDFLEAAVQQMIERYGI
jgi:hypothetical protein